MSEMEFGGGGYRSHGGCWGLREMGLKRSYYYRKRITRFIFSFWKLEDFGS